VPALTADPVYPALPFQDDAGFRPPPDYGPEGSRWIRPHGPPTPLCRTSAYRSGLTLTLHGRIGDLAAALRTFADALDREQARGTATYVATVEADAPDPAPGGMTAALAGMQRRRASAMVNQWAQGQPAGRCSRHRRAERVSRPGS
jgi:hypothetical protein